MNKIYTIITLLISGFSIAQVSIFDNLGDFETAYNGELQFEDFAGAPDEPTLCGTVVSANVENGCFVPGELIEGFSITASNNSDVVLLPAGFLPTENESPRLGANSGTEKSILTFDDEVYAVSLSLHIDSGNDFYFRAFGENDALLYESQLPFSLFVGIISDTPIHKIEVENAEGAGELFGDLRFGAGNMSVTDLQNAKISYYPNPVKNVLYLDSKEKISEVTIYDLSGKIVLNKNSFKNNDYNLDFNGLSQGVYVVEIKLDQGIESFQIIKK